MIKQTRDIPSARNSLKIIALSLFLFVLANALLLGLLYFYYKAEHNRIVAIIKEREIGNITMQHSIITNSLYFIINDLIFLSQQNELESVNDPGKADALEAMKREYLAISRTRHLYDQIRFINMQGKELIRINYNEGTPAIVPSNALQNKSARYYFRQTAVLQQGEVFLSPLDLNIEHGKVERPLKPVIRLGAPCFDREGKKLGIVVFNYLAENLLRRLQAAGKNYPSRKLLINSQGYWLLGPKPELEWGFMFADRKNDTIGKLYPKVWEAVRREAHGQVATPDGLFTFSRIYPPNEVARSAFAWKNANAEGNSSQHRIHGEGKRDYYWTVISYIPQPAYLDPTRSLKTNFQLVVAVMLLVSGPVAWMLASSIVNKRAYQAKLMYMAQYDALTGLPNRTLFFDRLQMAIQYARRYNQKFGLLYIDLDKFKAVNDSMGHPAGDELLVQVAQVLENAIRKSDTVARLGGDEFAVVLNQVNTSADLKAIAQKINKSLQVPFYLASGTVRIGASIGCALFPDHAEDAAGLIKVADEAMYTSKKLEEPVCVVSDC